MRDFLNGGTTLAGFAAGLGIATFKHPEPPLVRLKYQPHASRSHPLVRECRGLVLEGGSWEVVAKPFDRFDNADAVGPCDWYRSSCQSTEDGSMVIVYPYRGGWLVNISGGFGHHRVSFARRSWAQLCWETSALGVTRLDRRFTDKFELCPPNTEVVRPYPQAVTLLLAMFETVTCRESAVEAVDEKAQDHDQNLPGPHQEAGTGNLFNPSPLVPVVLAGKVEEVLACNPAVRQVAEGVKADLEAAWQNPRAGWARSWEIDDPRTFVRAIVEATRLTRLRLVLRRVHGTGQSEVHLRRVGDESGDLIAQSLHERASKREGDRPRQADPEVKAIVTG